MSAPPSSLAYSLSVVHRLTLHFLRYPSSSIFFLYSRLAPPLHRFQVASRLRHFQAASTFQPRRAIDLVPPHRRCTCSSQCRYIDR
ncbi:hypothetical protein RIF29_26467 [Crotalaria pallida]|uniref:Uncharacterized protein n=1 Tax=Crotalaria pallida TaxID=3830 RepID=A0AAN9EV32_CROPI